MNGSAGVMGSEAEFEAVLDYRFDRCDLLAAALTHPSAVRRLPSGGEHFERLEFLGDRVLALHIAELLLTRHPGDAEGELAKRLVGLVRRETLLDVAQEIKLDRYLHMAESGRGKDIRAADTVMADGCEALIGALYLDGGPSASGGFIERYWLPRLEAAIRPPSDAKTALQEWAQGLGRPLPLYRVIGREGPPHAPTFTIEVSVEAVPLMTGTGRSKRAAEQAAATLLLHHVGKDAG
jgi:ribonuclease-3